MKKVLVFLAIAGVVVYSKMSNRSDASSEFLNDMQALIATLDNYEDNAEFIDLRLKLRHTQAFADAYDAGSRRRGATFDEGKYIQDIFGMLIKDCNNGNRKELAVSLVELRSELMAVE